VQEKTQGLVFGTGDVMTQDHQQNCHSAQTIKFRNALIAGAA